MRRCSAQGNPRVKKTRPCASSLAGTSCASATGWARSRWDEDQAPPAPIVVSCDDGGRKDLMRAQPRPLSCEHAEGDRQGCWPHGSSIPRPLDRRSHLLRAAGLTGQEGSHRSTRAVASLVSILLRGGSDRCPKGPVPPRHKDCLARGGAMTGTCGRTGSYEAGGRTGSYEARCMMGTVHGLGEPPASMPGVHEGPRERLPFARILCGWSGLVRGEELQDMVGDDLGALLVREELGLRNGNEPSAPPNTTGSPALLTQTSPPDPLSHAVLVKTVALGEGERKRHLESKDSL